jgi:hypothetical protein
MLATSHIRSKKGLMMALPILFLCIHASDE